MLTKQTRLEIVRVNRLDLIDLPSLIQVIQKLLLKILRLFPFLIQTHLPADLAQFLILLIDYEQAFELSQVCGLVFADD